MEYLNALAHRHAQNANMIRVQSQELDAARAEVEAKITESNTRKEWIDKQESWKVAFEKKYKTTMDEAGPLIEKLRQDSVNLRAEVEKLRKQVVDAEAREKRRNYEEGLPFSAIIQGPREQVFPNDEGFDWEQSSLQSSVAKLKEEVKNAEESENAAVKRAQIAENRFADESRKRRTLEMELNKLNLPKTSSDASQQVQKGTGTMGVQRVQVGTAKEHEKEAGKEALARIPATLSARPRATPPGSTPAVKRKDARDDDESDGGQRKRTKVTSELTGQ